MGDPMRPLLWVSKSREKLAVALRAMNHAISADVHQSYMTPGSMFDQLREASEAVSIYIMRHLPKGAERQLTRRLQEQLAPG